MHCAVTSTKVRDAMAARLGNKKRDLATIDGGFVFDAATKAAAACGGRTRWGRGPFF